MFGLIDRLSWTVDEIGRGKFSRREKDELVLAGGMDEWMSGWSIKESSVDWFMM